MAKDAALVTSTSSMAAGSLSRNTRCGPSANSTTGPRRARSSRKVSGLRRKRRSARHGAKTPAAEAMPRFYGEAIVSGSVTVTFGGDAGSATVPRPAASRAARLSRLCAPDSSPAWLCSLSSPWPGSAGPRPAAAAPGRAGAATGRRRARASTRRPLARAIGRAPADDQRGVRRLLQGSRELGPLGRCRRTRRRQPDHRRQAQAGRVAGPHRPGRRPGALAAHGQGPRQRQPLRAHDEQGVLDRHLSRVVSRLRAQPSRRAVPHPLQGPDLQRLRAGGHQHRDAAAPSSASRASATATSRAGS